MKMAKKIETFEPSEIYIDLKLDGSAEAKILDLDGTERLVVLANDLFKLFEILRDKIYIKNVEHFELN
jgi:hypothetical protein